MDRTSVRHAVWFIPVCLATAKLLLHLTTNVTGGYGYFRDELYYLVSTSHLGFGYVDHPPLSIWLLALNKASLGESLFATRLLPAIFGAGTVYMTATLATALGGKRLAQILAGGASLVSLIILGFSSIYSMNAIDLFLAVCVLHTLVKITDEATSARWTRLGILLGLGLLNKTSFLWLGAGIAVGMAATTFRKDITSKAVLRAAAISGVFFLPYVLWNATNGFAHLEFIRNATTIKYSGLSIKEFVLGQGLINNPVTLPLLLVGPVALFVLENGRRRLIGWTVVTVFVILAINGHSKPEYFATMTPALFAAGAVALEGFRQPILRGVVRFVYVPLLFLGLAFAPVVVPMLSVNNYIAFSEAIGLKPQSNEGKKLSDLPQFYADMFGWEDLAKAVNTAYLTLDKDEQRNAIIFAQNYGEASAVNFFGKQYGLPVCVSGHNSYYLWGVGNPTPDAAIIVGGKREDHLRAFDQVDLYQHFHSRHIMPYEDNLPIYIARHRKVNLAEVWSAVKSYE